MKLLNISELKMDYTETYIDKKPQKKKIYKLN